MSSSGSSSTPYTAMFDSVDLQALLPRSLSRDEQDIAVDEETGMCDCLPTLSLKERLLGCATSMVAGYLLSLGSFVRVKDLLFGNPMPFVINATIGNIIALCGSCFMSGPTNQVKLMWHETRRIATGLYLGSLALTIVVASLDIPGPKGLLLLILMICQYVSIFWYCLSYIPYARDFLRSYCSRRFAASADQ